ncbi:ATP-binding protein [Pseudoxanthomonas wuyuanensis]
MAELLEHRPRLTETLSHPNFELCARELECFAEFGPGQLIVVVGPSQVGKSMLLKLFVEFLVSEVYRDVPQDRLPIIGANANLARDGRTAPKYLYEMLLGDAGSPLYNTAKLLEAAGYRPTKVSSEHALLAALTRGLRALKTDYVLADEAQFMVRASSKAFQASLLESLKSLISFQRSAVLVGGYEFAKVLLEYREHLASRPMLVHLERYRYTDDGYTHWLKVLKAFSESHLLEFENDQVLLHLAEELLNECLGVIGILQSRLLRSMAHAKATNTRISEKIVRSFRLKKGQWELLRTAIESGEETVNKLVEEEDWDFSGNGGADYTDKPKERRNRKPFARNPRRVYVPVSCG